MCPRDECQPCRGRDFLAHEAEKEALSMVTNNKEREVTESQGMRDREKRISKASCTSEELNYVIECITCRNKNTKIWYY